MPEMDGPHARCAALPPEGALACLGAAPREPSWDLHPVTRRNDQAVAAAAAACFTRLYQDCYAGEPFANPALPIEVRGLRRTEGWCVFLLLTPWMLARVYLAEHDPALPIPPGWGAQERRGGAPVVIGPTLAFSLLGTPQQAHLNHDPALGHYLVQPLVQALEKFDSAAAVFGAWEEVIATRLRVMEEQQRECRWQRELSRREFFSRLAGG